jgi:hypothetical protein
MRCSSASRQSDLLTGVAVKQLLGVILAGLLVVAAAAAPDDAEQVAGAEAAALAWLALTDSGSYAQSWDQAAGMFQGAISRESWISAVVNARQPLGKVISRKVKSALYTRSLPGAPAGEYVVIQYDTQFEQKATARYRGTTSSKNAVLA